MDNTSAVIAALNDQFRKNFTKGNVFLTCGVDALEDSVKYELCRQVQKFNNFTENNDPYGEHDFGAIDLEGHKFFWKIDCYDLKMEYGSENPADPKITRRVLTIMFADEY